MCLAASAVVASSFMAPMTSLAAVNPPVIALDPGHGGSENGKVGNGLVEQHLNYTISKYTKEELERYLNTRVVMTRAADETVSLPDRAKRAVEQGAAVLISQHNNSTTNTEVNGTEIFVSNLAQFRPSSTVLAQNILNELTGLGLYSRGVKVRLSENGTKTSTGETADYYAVIKAAAELGIPGLIVEHAFMTNAGDVANYLSTDEQLKGLALADARGIAGYYGLDASPCGTDVYYWGQYENRGWSEEVRNGKQTGYPGSGNGLTGLSMSLKNNQVSGGISYRGHGDNGWGAWGYDGATATTDLNGEWLEAVEIGLTGEAAQKYDVYYRVYAQGAGWLGWVKNGETAGSAYYDYKLEDIQVVLVDKGAAAPGAVTSPITQ